MNHLMICLFLTEFADDFSGAEVDGPIGAPAAEGLDELLGIAE
jgi:hypothetical protein